jgi:oligopeptide/dipeptide ABC transporter ATP-binding protein
LLESIARLDVRRAGRLRPISGSPPSMIRTPTGCRFHPRCPYSDEELCVFSEPSLLAVGARQHARCHFAREEGWFSPSERMTQPRDLWSPAVAAAEQLREAAEA